MVAMTTTVGLLGAWRGRGPIARGERDTSGAVLLATLVAAALAGTVLLRPRLPSPAVAGVLLICAAGLLQSVAYLLGSASSLNTAEEAGTDRLSSMEFRLPRASRAARLAAGTVLVAVLAGVVVWDVAGHRPWWVHLPALVGAVVVSAVLARRNARRRSPRLRLSEEGLELPGPDGIGRMIDWPNIARVEIRGRFSPRLMVTPVDPQLVRPPMTRWQWAAVPGWRRHELSVPLDSSRIDRRALHDELTRRLGASG
jgi:diacylglycerol kinase